MSDLKHRINESMKDAMRAKDNPRRDCIRLIMAEFKRIEVDERTELDDTRVLAVLDKMLKQRRDSISQFEQADRQDLADKEAYEVSVIQEFMPATLTEDEINSLIEQAIESTGASSMREMGAVMAFIKPRAQGRADMAQVSQQIKKRLT
jgi:hypothetical protein